MKIEIELSEPGSLRKQVIERKKEFQNADLKVVGRMNDADMKFIKQATGRNGFIKGIDLSYASGIYAIDRNSFEEGGVLNSAKLNSSVKQLGWGAFCMCDKLTSISLTSDIEAIENFSFNGCSALPYITLPKNLKKLGSQTFGGCTKLEEFKIQASNKFFSTDNGVIFSKDFSKLIKYPAGKKDKTYVFPEKVKTIGDYAFFMCDNLKNIVLPEGITSINEFAFGSCTTLQTIELPSTLKEIKANAFNKCESLHALTLSGIEPPVFTPDEFEMQHLNVYVPLMAIETYRQTDGWKNLKNLFGK
ncbi:MAG: leucine-rich repeat domain-containing protein [Paludibacteraceae bacterium]|nr:leucine-rich repeat domain-containing protein [Paludibacteraceae bacterium]MBR6105001.1 leucine-rich repeat domain-containing protein [Paludibacteraceae bacterium]